MWQQNIARVLAWILLTAIVALSLVPPIARPVTHFPHTFEHAAIFLLNGLAFGIAYRGYELLSGLGGVLFCASIELAQLMIPGRHARLSDFFTDTIAICVGIFAGSTLIRIARRYT
jgi:VanZ family protein